MNWAVFLATAGIAFCFLSITLWLLWRTNGGGLRASPERLLDLLKAAEQGQVDAAQWAVTLALRFHDPEIEAIREQLLIIEQMHQIGERAGQLKFNQAGRQALAHQRKKMELWQYHQVQKSGIFRP